MDIFERIAKDSGGPIGQYRERADGYFAFPRLEGELGPRMVFNGKEVLCWSLNNYLGLANHPAIRKADAEGAARWGLAAPMGARMMSGQTRMHEHFEKELADFEKKEAAYLFNFGYQGIVSTIDTLTRPMPACWTAYVCISATNTNTVTTTWLVWSRSFRWLLMW